MKTTAVICLLLAGVIAAHAAFGIFMASNGSNCGGGGFLVTADGTCANILTTVGADPLTP